MAPATTADINSAINRSAWAMIISIIVAIACAIFVIMLLTGHWATPAFGARVKTLEEANRKLSVRIDSLSRAIKSDAGATITVTTSASSSVADSSQADWRQQTDMMASFTLAQVDLVYRLITSPPSEWPEREGSPLEIWKRLHEPLDDSAAPPPTNVDPLRGSTP